MNTSSDFNRRIFNVRELGAAGDGIAMDTQALQKALDLATATEGGGIVLIPPGHYLTQPLRVGSNVRIHLEKGAVIQATQNVDDYPEWEGRGLFNAHKCPYNGRYLIGAEGAENISITGEGVIDGQGSVFFEENEGAAFAKVIDKKTRPARMLMFAVCKNVRFEGVTFKNSPAWTFWMVGCTNVTFENLVIESNLRHMNADGIDIDACRDVLIRNCRIQTGDDAIVLRSIPRMFNDERVCEQIRVENCQLRSSCNAIRLAYYNDGDIRNVVIDNVTIYKSCRGIICQIPLPAETPERNTQTLTNLGPIVENIRFSNIKIEARLPIWFRVSEGSRARNIGNITFENLDITGSTPSILQGNSATSIKNLSFNNIRLHIIDGEPCLNPSEIPCKAAAFIIANCENLSIRNLVVDGSNKEISDDTPLLYIENTPNFEAERIVNRSCYFHEPFAEALT